MPLYDFQCPEGTVFEAAFTMAAAPDSTACPECSQQARRRMSSPRLSIANSAEFKLIDSTKRSAHSPEVVTGLSPATKRATRYTHNPLHQKLPRP